MSGYEWNVDEIVRVMIAGAVFGDETTVAACSTEVIDSGRVIVADVLRNVLSTLSAVLTIAARRDGETVEEMIERGFLRETLAEVSGG